MEIVSSQIKKSSTAEYFSKNLQQVGFSSPTKAVLTTLKESMDNSLDACEEAGILPEITVQIKKEGQGSTAHTDLVSVAVEDNGPGASSKRHRQSVWRIPGLFKIWPRPLLQRAAGHWHFGGHNMGAADKRKRGSRIQQNQGKCKDTLGACEYGY